MKESIEKTKTSQKIIRKSLLRDSGEEEEEAAGRNQ
jgi:hypothetical protein